MVVKQESEGAQNKFKTKALAAATATAKKSNIHLI